MASRVDFCTCDFQLEFSMFITNSIIFKFPPMKWNEIGIKFHDVKKANGTESTS